MPKNDVLTTTSPTVQNEFTPIVQTGPVKQDKWTGMEMRSDDGCCNKKLRICATSGLLSVGIIGGWARYHAVIGNAVQSAVQAIAASTCIKLGSVACCAVCMCATCICVIEKATTRNGCSCD